jgi:hypothetical protein
MATHLPPDPLADVLSDSREVIQQLIVAVDALSDDHLQDPRLVGLLDDGEQLNSAFFFGHFHDEHEADMRAWLERVKKKASTLRVNSLHD